MPEPDKTVVRIELADLDGSQLELFGVAFEMLVKNRRRYSELGGWELPNGGSVFIAAAKRDDGEWLPLAICQTQELAQEVTRRVGLAFMDAGVAQSIDVTGVGQEPHHA